MRFKKLLLAIGFVSAMAVPASTEVFPTPCSQLNPVNCSRGTWGQELRAFFDNTYDLLTAKIVSFFDDVDTIHKYTSFEAAVTALCPTGDTSPEKTLIIPVATAVSANTTVCKPLTLEFTGAGRLDPASGVTVTINGPVISAKPLADITGGAGTVIFGTQLLNMPNANSSGDVSGIVDGSIVDADINASAAIADTKLANISTADKVRDSALAGRDSVLNYADFATAVSTIGSTVKTLVIPTVTASIVSNVTVPSTLTLKFTGAGQLNVGSVTLPTLLAAQYGTIEFTTTTMIRTTGSWITDGYNVADATVTITGSTSNNVTCGVASATALILTVDAGSCTLVAEAASAVETVNGQDPWQVSINGPLEAPLRQVFGGAGSVVGLTEAKAAWFGFLSTATGASNATALSDATTAASAVDIAPGSYTVQGNVNITTATVLTGYGATLNFTTDAANQGIKITSSNVSVFGLTLNGPQFAAFNTTQNAILAQGVTNASAAPTFISNIHIKDNKMTGWGSNAVELLVVEEFDISHNTVNDCYSYGYLILSGRFGTIDSNRITGVIADGVAGTNAYGITLTKNNGTETRFPVPHHITVTNNVLDDMRTWKALDTHGGHDLVYANNLIRNARTGIGITHFPNASSPGSGTAPLRVTVTGNTIQRGTLVSAADVVSGIRLNGEGTASLDIRATGNVISGNTIDGYGDDAILNGVGGIHVQYTGETTVVGNTISNSGRHAIQVFSSQNLNISDNTIDTVSGTAAIAPTGTIQIVTNPADGDTVVLNGATWTFKTSATAGAAEITIGGSQSATATNMAAALNTSGKINDGRISTATYSAVADTVTVTADTIGTSMNYYSLNAGTAGAKLTLSGATLAGGVAGSAGISIQQLSAIPALEGRSTGIVSNNVFNVGVYTGIQSVDDNTGLNYHNNLQLGTGPLYDLKGSSSAPQSGSGNIIGLLRGKFKSDITSLSAGASISIYAPAPGVPSTDAIATISTNNLGATFAGLSIAVGATANNSLQILILNTSSGALDLVNTTFSVTVDKISGSAVAIE